VHVEAFEAWDAQARTFALVYAATAWHWIDPAIRYRKAHALLRPGGHLAFWSAQHAFPRGFDPFFSEIQEVYDAIGESYRVKPGRPASRGPARRVGGDRVDGLSTDVTVKRYVWEVTYTAESTSSLLDTFSGHMSMDAAKRVILYDEVRRRIGARRGPDGCGATGARSSTSRDARRRNARAGRAGARARLRPTRTAAAAAAARGRSCPAAGRR
jgi:SAM-dependent methyltransferase